MIVDVFVSVCVKLVPELLPNACWDRLQLPAILNKVGWMMDVWRMTVEKEKQVCASAAGSQVFGGWWNWLQSNEVNWLQRCRLLGIKNTEN